jgi:hypothetical protein
MTGFGVSTQSVGAFPPPPALPSGVTLKATDPMATALNEAQRAFMAQRETLVGVAAGLDRVAGASSAVASAESRLRSEIERTNSALANRGKEVRSQVEHGGFRAVAKASGSLTAIVGRMDSSAAPARVGGIGRM